MKTLSRDQENAAPLLADILLVSDCDGTLFQEDKTISPKDREAIERFRLLGGNFTVATGRSIPTGMPSLRTLSLNLPCILYNGSMLYDPYAERILWMEEIPKPARFLVPEVLARFGDAVGAEVLTPEGLFVLSFNDLIREHLHGAKPFPYERSDFIGVRDHKWLKVMFAAKEEGMPELRAFLQGLGAPGIRLVRSERYYFEVMPEKASKGAALKMLAQQTGFLLENTVSIGDCDNDLEMLKASGIGVAVGNAFPDVLRAADYVTKSNAENAVACVIGELLENRECFFKNAKANRV